MAISVSPAASVRTSQPLSSGAIKSRSTSRKSVTRESSSRVNAGGAVKVDGAGTATAGMFSGSDVDASGYRQGRP